MRYKSFKEHEIKRKCKKKFNTYSQYREYLMEDFGDRCCYCNMKGDMVTSPFHIDHFIPKDTFEHKKDELLTDYNNLMWSCPKCNRAKGQQYKGDFLNTTEIVNEYFYNPVEVDYNDIFYRNELGGIESEDVLGRDMIKRLCLYRPIHKLAWMVERMEVLVNDLEKIANKELDEQRKAILEEAAGKVARECLKKSVLFRKAYTTRNFVEKE